MKNFFAFIFTLTSLCSWGQCINSISGSAGSLLTVSGSNCQVRLCVSVPASGSRPKQIQFALTSSTPTVVAMCSNGSTSTTLPLDCGGGSNTFAGGTYCYTFTVPGGCSSAIAGNVTGYTNANGGVGGLCNTVNYSLSPLPVELLDFTGKAYTNHAVLQWATASEKANDGFEIQKSLDAISFENIGFVKGVGESTTKQSYAFVDEAFVTTSYFRLKQKDFNGNEALSRVIAVVPEHESLENVAVFPNPATSEANILMPMNVATLQVRTPDGRLVHQQKMASQAVTPLDVSQWGSGLYVLEFTTALEHITKKLLVR